MVGCLLARAVITGCWWQVWITLADPGRFAAGDGLSGQFFVFDPLGYDLSTHALS